MSHVIEVKCEVKNLDALEVAAGRLGMTLIRGQKTYKWYGRYVGDYALPEGYEVSQLGRCDHALVIDGRPGAYQVGVVEHADGTYRLLWDFWSGGFGLQETIGPKGDKLTTEYAMAAAEATIRNMGWMYERQGDTLVVYHPSGGTLRVSADQVDAAGFTGSACVEPTKLLADAIGGQLHASNKPEIGHININTLETE